MPRKSTMSVEERFWSKVDTSGPCWLWLGSKDPRGYGRFTIQHGDQRLAHRMAYALTHGLIPDGLHICHTCDHPPCVNPSHLFAGTASDNMRDAVRKGRHVNGAKVHPERVARGDRHGLVKHPERVARGDRHGNAILTDAQVLEIRRLHQTGTLTQTRIAQLFGVSLTTVCGIVRRRRWKHI